MKFLPIALALVWLAACSRGKPEPPSESAPEQQSRVAVLTLEAQDHFGIAVAPVRRQRLAEYLQVLGTVQPVSSRLAQVRPLSRGRVLDVAARIGDRVRAGQPLARLDNIEAGELIAQLASAQADLNRLAVQSAAQARETERSRRLTELGAVSHKEYDQARAEQDALQQSQRAQQSVIAGLVAKLHRFGVRDSDSSGSPVTTVAAPFDGIVIQANAAPGEVVAPETVLFAVADLSQVWVQAEVYEKDLGRLRIGQPALITVDAYPERPFHGAVTYVGDTLDPQTRTVKVRCEVANPAALLKLDMFAAVQLPTTFDREVIAMPADAIQQLDGGDFVFVRAAPTRFEARQVQPGRRVGTLREIVSGLREGEPVVTQGSFRLKSVLVGKGLGEE